MRDVPWLRADRAEFGHAPVNGAGRFRVEAWHDERQGVATADGHEATTGLPVRIRRFHGPPRGDPSALDHPNLPGVIAVQREHGETRLVTLVSRGYRALAERPAALEVSAVLDAADALATLHRAGIVHGGIGPRHLLLGPDGHLVLDGAGAPWRPSDGDEPEPTDDVRALAATLLGAGDRLPPAVAHVLERAATRRDGGYDAERLSGALGEAASASGAPARSDGAGQVVKDLPPGGVYKSGESHRPPRPGSYDLPGGATRPRRALRLPWRTVVLLGVALAVGLAAVALQDRPGPPAPGDAGAFVVDVRVEPVAAPPLEIVVIDAPEGSALSAGTRLGRAPRRIAFDAPGRWVVQGLFGSRRSELVAFRLPGATTVTVTLPPADRADGPSAP